jgi:transposase
MDAIIAAPASCEVRAVIRFLLAERQSAAEIHRRLCRVYGDNVMSDSSVREWCRKFRDGRTDVHDEGGQGRHSTVTDELVEKFDQCVRGNHRLTISELSEEFTQISRTTLYRIVTDRLGYHKFCARWVPKQLTDLPHYMRRKGFYSTISHSCTDPASIASRFCTYSGDTSGFAPKHRNLLQSLSQGCINPRRLSFVQWRLIYMDRQYVTSFTSSSWRLEFIVDS